MGETVRTPSGAFATVISLNPDAGEVLVEWPDGRRACFRLVHLRPMPGGYR